MELPKYIEDMLQTVCLPLENDVKNKHKKESLCNDFLLVSRKINIILERLFNNIYYPKNNKTAAIIDDQLRILFSNIVLLNYIAVSGWKCAHYSSIQEKKLNKMLRELSKFSREFLKYK